MVRLVTARYIGGNDTVYPFRKNQTYPLALTTHWYSKGIEVYQCRGFESRPQAGTEHYFENQEYFENCWEILEDDNTKGKKVGQRWLALIHA